MGPVINYTEREEGLRNGEKIGSKLFVTNLQHGLTFKHPH